MKFSFPLYQYEIDNGIDVPMIHPLCIPHGYIQAWDSLRKKYFFAKGNAHTGGRTYAHWGTLTE